MVPAIVPRLESAAMAEAAIPIFRKKDLAIARQLAEDVRRQKGLPASFVIPEWIIAKLADMLGDFRVEWDERMAEYLRELDLKPAAIKADLDAEIAGIRAMMDAAEARHRIALDAAEAFVKARKALNAALAMLRPHGDLVPAKKHVSKGLE
jgi:hypothetical protein